MSAGFWIFVSVVIVASAAALFTPRLSLATLLKVGAVAVIVPVVFVTVSFLRRPTLEEATRASCVNNLRQIDSAKEQWALENKVGAGRPVKESEVNVFIKGGEVECGGHGIYRYGRVGEPPVCSLPSHKIR